jgi:hypothetical protein
MNNNHFSSNIKIIGINPCVDVPEDIIRYLLSSMGRKNGPIPVKGVINGIDFLQTIVKFKGAWRLYVNTQLRRDTGLKVGDYVDVILEFDPDPRIVPMPKELDDALSRNKEAGIAFINCHHLTKKRFFNTSTF